MPRDAFSEIMRGRGYGPKDEERHKDPLRKYVPIEEIPGPDSNPEENLIRKEEREETAEEESARSEREESEARRAKYLEEEELEEEEAGANREFGKLEVGVEELEREQKGEKLIREERLRLAKEKRSARAPWPGERPAQKPRYKTEEGKRKLAA